MDEPHDELPTEVRWFAPWTWDAADRWFLAFILFVGGFILWIVAQAIEATFAV